MMQRDKEQEEYVSSRQTRETEAARQAETDNRSADQLKW